MNIARLIGWMAASATLALAACGGGGSSGGIGGTGGGGGGIGGTGVAYGTITAFGSVWVNGVEYETSNTTFKTDDNPNGGGRQDDLRVGMVVRVDGSISGKTASTITEDESVKGRVEQVVDANRMIVMGQTIQVDSSTRYDNGVVPVAGDYVEVHGQIAGDGVISGSYIERKTPPSPITYAVKGSVKNQNTANQTFQVGTLTVQYASATVGDMPAGSWNGLQVNIKGSSCGGVAPVCGNLVATKVEPAGARVASAPQAEIEGVVVAVSANGFAIGNQQVVTTTSTRYEGGVAADLIVGTKVEAEGSISNGVLTATKVSFRDAVKIEGDIATVNGDTLTISGLPGITVTLTSFTERKDVPAGGLAAGQHLRLRGKLGNGNGMVATRLEVRSADTDVELQAPVQALTPETSLRLLGVDITTTTGMQYRDLTDAAISRSAFFAAARVNGLVKANGTRAGATVTWTELELED